MRSKKFRYFSFLFLKRIYLFIFRHRGRGAKGEEKHQCVAASHAPPTGDPLTAQEGGLTGNSTNNPLLCRQAFNPVSHTSQGFFSFLKIVFQVQLSPFSFHNSPLPLSHPASRPQSYPTLALSMCPLYRFLDSASHFKKES